MAPSRSLRSRIGGIFRVLSSTPSVVEELIGQQSEMYERFRELRQAYATLESRAEDLQQEVEQRRRTEELLRQKDRELHQSLKLETVGQLAAGIAHDFNNVLTAVSAYAEMLETELAGSEDGRELVEGITATIDRATELTNKLLAFSRRQHLEPRRLDVNRVIAEQLDVVRRVLSGVEIETSLAPDVSTVILDPVQLQQVVFNLVINARDAMPAGGTLRIRTENAITDGTDPTRVVRISIADTGRGMDAVTLARAYEPFFTTKGPGGTGLGLSTVKAIVAQGGGRIDVASAPGRGTRFRIELPAVEGEPEVVERREWGTPPAAGGGESILLVDDDEALLQILSLSLEAAGYRVYIARSVAEALRVASSLDGALDLVVTDVLLGDGRGPELVARIRRDEPGVRALAISGLAATDAGNGETDLPMLRKPFTPTQLLRRVSRFLAEPATEPRSPDPGAPPSPTSGGTPRPT